MPGHILALLPVDGGALSSFEHVLIDHVVSFDHDFFFEKVVRLELELEGHPEPLGVELAPDVFEVLEDGLVTFFDVVLDELVVFEDGQPEIWDSGFSFDFVAVEVGAFCFVFLFCGETFFEFFLLGLEFGFGFGIGLDFSADEFGSFEVKGCFHGVVLYLNFFLFCVHFIC